MNLSLLIHTFNGYNHIWPGCLKAWRATPMPIPMYFGTDEHTDIDLSPFTPLYSGSGNWSDRLLTLLSKIPTDYVLYMQEDHWPIQSPPDLAYLMELVNDYQLLRLQISPINQFYSLTGTDKPYFFHHTSKYLVSHQPSIWKKSFFMEQIQHKEDPWINEYEGTKRLNKLPELASKIAIYPYHWYKHTCIKGKLVETQ
jgi:hypothetical protein